jgi:TonB family protein
MKPNKVIPSQNKRLEIRTLDMSFISSISLLCLFFTFVKAPLTEDKVIDGLINDGPIDFVSVEKTRQKPNRVKPTLPDVPTNNIEEMDDELEPINVDDPENQTNFEPNELGGLNFGDEDGLPVEFIALEVQPKVLKAVKPEYPRTALELGIQGLVVVSFVIDEKGKPQDVKIIKGKEIFHEAAIQAAEKYQFSPGFQRDVAVKVKYQIPIWFKIQK